MSEPELHFYPYYESLLRKRKKWTTIRLGNDCDKHHKGDIVTITIGWNEDNAVPICKAQITDVTYKKIKDITAKDLKGESPDCQRKVAVPYVLSAIYRKTVTNNDFITIIHWSYRKNSTKKLKQDLSVGDDMHAS